MTRVIVNGLVQDSQLVNISPFNNALLSSFAVYESLKLKNANVIEQTAHINRLFDSAKLINLNHNLSIAQVEDWIKMAIEENRAIEATVRLLLLGSLQESENPTLYIYLKNLPQYSESQYKKGVRVITSHYERLIPKAKTINVLASSLARQEAHKEDAFESLLVNREDEITEGSRTNFFAVKEGCLHIPPQDLVLQGVTAARVIKLAENLTKIVEESIHIDKLNSFDGFFLTSTSMGIMPIASINGVSSKQIVPELTSTLMKKLNEYYGL